jgi:hypothetical protein
VAIVSNAQRIEHELDEAGLRLCPIWVGKAGESEQVRQVVRCKTSGGFIAFFCQYSAPNRQHNRYINAEIADRRHMSTSQFSAAVEWLKYMAKQYPASKIAHPSR